MKPHITDNKPLHEFFSFVSKAVLIIPIIIVILSLFFKFNQPRSSSPILNLVTPTVSPIVKNNSFKLDLKGPIVCENLFIKNKNILLKNKTTNYLLNDDCLYTWETGETNGNKKCGLKTYINLAENYLGSMDINDFANNDMIKDKIKGKDIDLIKLVQSCKREEIEDENIFGIPKQVKF